MVRMQVVAAFSLVTLTCLAGVCAQHNAVAQTAQEHTAAAEFREADVTLNGLRFHYLEWGNQNAPALLLIPGTGGGGGCAEYWKPLASSMRDRYHIYAMEQRGQCDSEWAKEYTWQRVVEDIDGFVDKFHLAPVTLVGHSSGAVWSYLYAAQHPENVARLVAVDGGGAFNWPKTRAEAKQRAPLATRHVTFSSPEEAVTYAKTRWRTDPSVDAVAREWVLHGIRKLDDGRWGWRQDPAAVAATDQYIFLPIEDELNGAFPRIKCPTLIVRGSEGAVSRELASQVAHAIANGSWAEVANSGHVVPLANPSGLLAVVEKFLPKSPEPKAETARPSSVVAEQELDAVKVDPKHYKIDFENDRVRVVRIQYGPHEKSVMHEHPGDRVGIYLTDFHVRNTSPDGSTREVHAKAGKTLWRAPAVRHFSENLNGQPLEALWVELKPPTSQTLEKKASGEVVKQTVRALDEQKAGKQAPLEQQDRNPQSEAEARRVISAWNRAVNARDAEGMRDASNFPLIHLGSGKVFTRTTRADLNTDNWPPGAGHGEGWHHSTIDSVEFVQSGPEKVHALVMFSRYRRDGTRYATYTSLWIITKQDGHWGIQCRSSFAP